MRLLLSLLTLASLVVAGCVAPASAPEVAGTATGFTPPDALAVIAHVDTGINPYHVAFRDDSPLAHVHPSEYLPGYPADARALNLTLDASSWEAALEADADVWASVERGELYWIPGTRIVGAVSFGRGGTSCPLTDPCEDRPILDDHGHGTMTASRMAAGNHSLCPTCRIVSVEGLSGDNVRWLADQGWVDVQSNSWGSLVPHPVAAALGADIYPAFRHAAERMVTLAGSGNGLGFFLGFAPWPTYLTATAPAGVYLVGAHDNGKVAHWSGSPPHVVADGYGGWHAERASLTAYSTSGVSCCTSSSSPYAAGGAAALILEARQILGHTGAGIVEGVVAEGPAGLVAEGPLADGVFTLEEARSVLLGTATARPSAREDDGSAHWLSRPGAPDPSDPAGNPYCPGCWTLPVAWRDLPEDAPAYPFVGYGAVDVESATLAEQVLRGERPLPERTEHAYYATDQRARELLYP